MRTCELELESFNMEAKQEKSETYHELSHSFKEEVIVPTVALTNTYDFFMYSRAKKNVRTADGIECEVEGYEEKHVCELEDDIKRLYGIDAWSFIKKWYNYSIVMTNMMMVRIFMKKK